MALIPPFQPGRASILIFAGEFKFTAPRRRQRCLNSVVDVRDGWKRWRGGPVHRAAKGFIVYLLCIAFRRIESGHFIEWVSAGAVPAEFKMIFASELKYLLALYMMYNRRCERPVKRNNDLHYSINKIAERCRPESCSGRCWCTQWAKFDGMTVVKNFSFVFDTYLRRRDVAETVRRMDIAL